jgi:hypothetical protein
MFVDVNIQLTLFIAKGRGFLAKGEGLNSLNVWYNV